jgi:hypothetical protein
MSTERTRALRERREAGIAYRPHIDVSWEDVAHMVRHGYLDPSNTRDRKKIEEAAQKLWRHLLSGGVATT